MVEFCSGRVGDDPLRKKFLELAGILDNFNNGNVPGYPHCSKGVVPLNALQGGPRARPFFYPARVPIRFFGCLTVQWRDISGLVRRG